MYRVGVALVLIGLLAACSESVSKPEGESASVAPAGVPVVVASPRALPATLTLGVTGRLEAADELQLSFKTGGVVAKVNVDIGDTVSKGQVLARLDSTEVDAEVKRAEEAWQKAVRDRERTDRLHAQGLVSQEVFDNARMAVDVAEAGLQAARFNQAHATIVAPANGRVLARLVRGREMVAAGAPVLTVSGEGSGWLLRTTVADKDAVKLRTGETAWVSVDAWPDKRFDAIVNRIAGMADPATGTFEVEVALLSVPKNVLRSGMIGRADIAVHNDLQGLLVPVSALVDIDNGVARFYVVEGDKARLRSGRVSRLLGDDVVMQEGVSENDAVVVAGAPYVNDQQSVMRVTDMAVTDISATE